MYGYIYETENLINGKKYIGLHKWAENTIDESYLGSGVALVKAVKKYGSENFKCRILQFCETKEELEKQEIFWIDYYNAVSSERYYNMSEGGIGGSHGENFHQPVTDKMLKALEKGRHLPASEKQKRQLAERRRNFVPTEETRKKLRIAGAKGVLGWSEESFRKASERCKRNNPGKNKTKATVEKIRQGSLDRVHIHKGTLNKNPKRSELDNYLTDGWELGYYYKLQGSTTMG